MRTTINRNTPDRFFLLFFTLQLNLSLSLFAKADLYATPSPPPPSLVQFTANEHIMAFLAGGISISGRDHMLQTDFISGSKTEPMVHTSASVAVRTEVLQVGMTGGQESIFKQSSR